MIFFKSLFKMKNTYIYGGVVPLSCQAVDFCSNKILGNKLEFIFIHSNVLINECPLLYPHVNDSNLCFSLSGCPLAAMGKLVNHTHKQKGERLT